MYHTQRSAAGGISSSDQCENQTTDGNEDQAKNDADRRHLVESEEADESGEHKPQIVHRVEQQESAASTSEIDCRVRTAGTALRRMPKALT